MIIIASLSNYCAIAMVKRCKRKRFARSSGHYSGNHKVIETKEKKFNIVPFQNRGAKNSSEMPKNTLTARCIVFLVNIVICAVLCSKNIHPATNKGPLHPTVWGGTFFTCVCSVHSRGSAFISRHYLSKKLKGAQTILFSLRYPP